MILCQTNNKTVRRYYGQQNMIHKVVTCHSSSFSGLSSFYLYSVTSKRSNPPVKDWSISTFVIMCTKESGIRNRARERDWPQNTQMSDDEATEEWASIMTLMVVVVVLIANGTADADDNVYQTIACCYCCCCYSTAISLQTNSWCALLVACWNALVKLDLSCDIELTIA